MNCVKDAVLFGPSDHAAIQNRDREELEKLPLDGILVIEPRDGVIAIEEEDCGAIFIEIFEIPEPEGFELHERGFRASRKLSIFLGW